MFIFFLFHFLEMKRQKEREEKRRLPAVSKDDDFEESSLTRSHGYWTEGNVGEREDLQKQREEGGREEATGASLYKRALKRAWKIISWNTPAYSIHLFEGYFSGFRKFVRSSLFLLRMFFPLLFIFLFWVISIFCFESQTRAEWSFCGGFYGTQTHFEVALYQFVHFLQGLFHHVSEPFLRDVCGPPFL